MSPADVPLVSILIPAYNSEQLIGETIESALAQTYRNREIIVVDDGSKDGTLGVARRYRADGVRTLTQTRLGAAAARNNAYSVCRGDYIQWLDADDILHPEKIEKQVEAIRQGAGARMLLSSAWTYFFYRYRRARFRPTALWCDLGPAEWLMRKMERNLHMQTATWLVSRELSEAAGPWDRRLLVDDDGEYLCRVMLACEGIRFVSDARTYYRRSGSSRLSYIGDSSEKKDAQFLSMQLHIRALLSLEDSARSRAACVTYLQNWLIHFYPDKPELIESAARLASELGGSLSSPTLPLKYGWIKAAFGWGCARRAQQFSQRLKCEVVRHLDRAIQRTQAG